MVENWIPFELPGFRMKSVENRADHLTIVAQATATEGACPHCGKRSSQIHSHYTRSPQDVPSSGKTVRLVLKVRRFRCLNEAYSAVTFAERRWLAKAVKVSLSGRETCIRCVWCRSRIANCRLSSKISRSFSCSDCRRNKTICRIVEKTFISMNQIIDSSSCRFFDRPIIAS